MPNCQNFSPDDRVRDLVKESISKKNPPGETGGDRPGDFLENIFLCRDDVC